MSFFISSRLPKAEKEFSVAIVRAEFNDSFTKRLLEHTLTGLAECGIEEKSVEIFEVPGSLEIPFACAKIMQTKKFDGIIVLGAVIRGETYHFDIVANESARAVMDLSMKGEIPLISGVLTVEDEAQLEARLVKGESFGKGLVQMMNFNLHFDR